MALILQRRPSSYFRISVVHERQPRSPAARAQSRCKPEAHMAISTAPCIAIVVSSQRTLRAFPTLTSFQLTSADVVLLDLGPPHAYGLDLIRQIHARVPDIVILVLTALGMPDSRVQALKTGAQRYLVKPTRFAVLVKHIETPCVRNEKHATPFCLRSLIVSFLHLIRTDWAIRFVD